MSRQADCPSCLTGIHDGHDPKWNIRDGLIGGNYCGCTGDCAERAKAAFDRVWDAIVQPSENPTSPAQTPDWREHDDLCPVLNGTGGTCDCAEPLPDDDPSESGTPPGVEGADR